MANTKTTQTSIGTVNNGFAYKAGDTIQFSTGTYTVLAVVEIEDMTNAGRLLLKKNGARLITQSFIRKSGLCSPVIKSGYKSLEDALSNLKLHGAAVKG